MPSFDSSIYTQRVGVLVRLDYVSNSVIKYAAIIVLNIARQEHYLVFNVPIVNPFK